ncbi:MAG: ABC transporter ATP-binding protein [Burkholderiales bacterium]
MLRLKDVSVSYGGLHALRGVSISVGAGEFVAIVGPNGAGKSTLFRAISGVVALAGGDVEFEGQSLSSTDPADRPALGIAHVPEGRQVFSSLTVMENLLMGAQSPAARRAWPSTRKRVFDLFPHLEERQGQYAGTLSGGEQQMVAIARGLASCPRLLMLDEPSMGLAPKIADQIFSTVQKIHKEEGIAVLLVEQRAAEALSACDHGYVLDSGRVALAGNREVLLAAKHLARAYLGT